MIRISVDFLLFVFSLKPNKFVYRRRCTSFQIRQAQRSNSSAIYRTNMTRISYKRLIPSMDMEIGQYCLFGGGHRQHHPTKHRTNVLCCPGPIVIRICNLFISCRASILVSWWIKNFINVVVRIIFMFFLDKNRRTKKARSIFSPITSK